MSLRSDEAFKKIEARLATVDPNNRKVVHVFKFKIKKDGAVVKTMMLDLVNVKVYEGDDAAECTIIIDDDLLADIVAKKIDAMQALNEDRVEVEGNLELLYVLKDQLSSV
jgi:putative sterol carrier protein